MTLKEITKIYNRILLNTHDNYAELKMNGSSKLLYVSNHSSTMNKVDLFQSKIGGKKLIDAFDATEIEASNGAFRIMLNPLSRKYFLVE